MISSGFTHRNAKTLMRRMAVLVVLASVVSTATAQTPGLQYTFVQGVDNLTVPGGINDVSGHGHNGTVIDFNLAELVAGPSGNMNAIHIDNDNEADETGGSGINTGTPTDNPDLNIFNGPYTAMAWVNLDDQFLDHMVFGTPLPNAPGATSASAGSLHLGFRNMQVYNGWWGAGTGRDSAFDNQGNRGYVGQVGEWHHVAWRFTGSGGPGYQDIFQDGILYQRFRSQYFYGDLLAPGDGGVPNVPVNLLIGRNVGNNGAFAGSLSDVRVYNVALSDDEIAAIAASPP